MVSCSSSQADSGLLWSDDFDGPQGRAPDARLWSFETGGGGWGNDELQTYTDATRNASLDGQGHLVITARREGSQAAAAVDARWTSARLTTAGRRTVTTGRLDVRARVPAGTGIWPAIWTVGSDVDEVGWPQSGETDLLETVGDASSLLQTVHGARSDGTTQWQTHVSTTPAAPLDDAFHVYSAVWSETSVRFLVDGTTTGTVHRADIPDGAAWPFGKPQQLILNVAVGGSLPGDPDDSTPAVNTMTVDYVRAYAGDAS